MHDELKQNGPRRISPFFIPGSIINMIAGLLSIEVGAKGPNLAMVTACTTSTHCIGEREIDPLRRGRCDDRPAREGVITELAVAASPRRGRFPRATTTRPRRAVHGTRSATASCWRGRGAVVLESTSTPRRAGRGFTASWPAMASRPMLST